MHKMKVGIYCYLIADILCVCGGGGEGDQKFLMSGPLPNINCCPNPTIPLVVMAIEILNFLNIFKTNQLLRSYKGYKAETLQKFS